jgi:hypothetical protein
MCPERPLKAARSAEHPFPDNNEPPHGRCLAAPVTHVLLRECLIVMSAQARNHRTGHSAVTVIPANHRAGFANCRRPNRRNRIPPLTFLAAKGLCWFRREFASRPLRGAVVIPFPIAKAIERPVCKKCGADTMLARISPEGAGFKTRSFECPKCHHVYIERVATDRIEICRGWLSSELKPPS